MQSVQYPHLITLTIDLIENVQRIAWLCNELKYRKFRTVKVAPSRFSYEYEDKILNNMINCN